MQMTSTNHEATYRDEDDFVAAKDALEAALYEVPTTLESATASIEARRLTYGADFYVILDGCTFSLIPA